MLYPIAIEIGNDNYAYGVVVPDINGCFSAGDSLDEAINNVKDSIEMSLELYAESNILPPVASELSDIQSNSDYHGWVLSVVDIDVEPYMTK